MKRKERGNKEKSRRGVRGGENRGIEGKREDYLGRQSTKIKK